jgi:transaldolase/glucose-6-phosphate isomerase
MTNPVQEAHLLGQAVWLDYIRRGLIESGEFQKLTERGISGVTSNPTIFEKAIVGSTDYDKALLNLAQEGKTADKAYEALVIEDIQLAADILRPVYENSRGVDGYACLEVSPLLAHDTEATVAEARRLFAALQRPNAMIKVPATPEGLPAIRRLIGHGINVNVTLIFSLDRYQEVMEAYIAGIEGLMQGGGEPGRVASVASFFLSRVDTSVDSLLEERIRGGQEELRVLLGRAAVSSARLAYQLFRITFAQKRFASLRTKGARVQRPLWASTGTKNPAYSDLLYVEPLIGPDTVNTMPPDTLNAFLDHGGGESTVDLDVAGAEGVLRAIGQAGISMDSVTEKLLTDGVKAFAVSYEKLIAGIQDKQARLLLEEHVHPGKSLGRHLPDVEAALIGLERDSVVGRLWQKDHTVWKPHPTEIADRLGWLNVVGLMQDQVDSLQAFAEEVRDAGFRQVVLLGMGGSSLGPEVIRQTFGSAADYPELIVLDSIVPSWVESVTRSLDISHALFLVSSKSGTTIEPLFLMKHFRSLVESAVGTDEAGSHFVAITDPETPLAGMAKTQGFRRTFVNPSDIGGRYSVLSYFGLVPAALMGVDIAELLDRADRMREACASCVPIHDNPGAWLGATIATLSLHGIDKLTLITSPTFSSFGLWAEQLLAESTGKEGKGVIPISGEPLVEPSSYGGDRLFVYLRAEGDDNSPTDGAIEGIESSGLPVMVLRMGDTYDLGAEFFRWEFATAIAGAIMGINPFDQPNVQTAKDAAQRMLREYLASGQLPKLAISASVNTLLADQIKGKYLAVMAYLRQTPELERTMETFRRRVVTGHSIATTFGYGPRFLHSTGQLHKGGPDTGLFLQVTESHANDLPIPGEPYTFGVVADAQALGDLQALMSLGRPVVRVHLSGSSQDNVTQLSNRIMP